MKTLVRLAAATVLFGAASSAQAAPVIFFGEDLNTTNRALTTHANADAARDSFFSNLTGVGTETFESQSTGANAPFAINFGSAGTATLTGVGSVQNTYDSGRYAISGSKYLNTDGTFALAFSRGISAFGFYGTDLGDFGAKLVLTLTGSNGVTTLTVPNETGTKANGSALYYGFYDTANTYTAISFAGAGTDLFGFDNLSIGNRASVTPTPAVPEPATWAMMLVGFGAAGVTLRRRRQANAKVSFA